MKLSYRDKVILIAFIVVVIIVIGIFAFIKPKMKQIETNKAEFTKVQAERDQVQAKIDQIKPLGDQINQVYTDASKLAGNFTQQMNSYELDKFFQPYLDKNEMKINSGMTISEPQVGALDYYAYTPSVLTYPLYEAADLNGKYAAEAEALLKESKYVSQQTSESVVVTSVGFDFHAKKENLLKFLDEVSKIKGSALITSLNITDYTFGEKLEPTPENKDKIGFADGEISIDVYSVKAVDKPVLNEVK